MPYICDISPGQHIVLDNQASYTIVTLTSSSPGQQQQTSSRYQTGSWTSPPTIARLADGIVITIFAEQGTTQIKVQGQAIALSNQSIDLNRAQPLQVQQTMSQSSSASMPPMQPMQPMEMGNMSMQMKPMEMRMGTMEMRMDDTKASSTKPETVPGQSDSESQSAPVQRKFCSQCGARVTSGDRFCSQCGCQL